MPASVLLSSKIVLRKIKNIFLITYPGYQDFNKVSIVQYTQRKLFEILLKQTEIRLYQFIIFRLIWNQTDVRLVPNQSENGVYVSMCERSTRVTSALTKYMKLTFISDVFLIQKYWFTYPGYQRGKTACRDPTFRFKEDENEESYSHILTQLFKKDNKQPMNMIHF